MLGYSPRSRSTARTGSIEVRGGEAGPDRPRAARVSGAEGIRTVGAGGGQSRLAPKPDIAAVAGASAVPGLAAPPLAAGSTGDIRAGGTAGRTVRPPASGCVRMAGATSRHYPESATTTSPAAPGATARLAREGLGPVLSRESRSGPRTSSRSRGGWRRRLGGLRARAGRIRSRSFRRRGRRVGRRAAGETRFQARVFRSG